MKIAIFSDTHLRLPFEEKKFKFLERVVKKVDQVIINGDFWDGYIISFSQFINSPWKNLFPLLKLKKAVYIFGNHDKKILSNGKLDLFSQQQTTNYEIRADSKSFIFEHGNRLSPALDDQLRLKKIPTMIQKTLTTFHDYFVRKQGKEFLRRRFSKYNKVIKKKIKDKLEENQFFFCGHTHWAEIDEKNHFANSGIVAGGLGQYLIIEDEGKITLKEEWYE
jgi:predicted phosphodiesterase